jgi:hypothetical protein
VSFTNPTFMVGLQLLNVQLLKVILRCVTAVKSGHQTTGNVRVKLSDESSFTRFPTSGRVYIWRICKEAYNLECLVPRVKHRGGSGMVWATISWYSNLFVLLLPFMSELLQGSTWTGWWVIRCIPWSRHYFQTMTQFSKMMTVPPFTQLELFSHDFKGMKVDFHLLWPAQTPDLNIIQSHWSVLETRVRSRFLPLTSLK